MVACGSIAFHIYKDDCPTVIIIFHYCYSAILLKYPVVVDHQYYLCILYNKKILWTRPLFWWWRYWKVIALVTIDFHMHKHDCPTVLIFFQHCYPTIMLEYPVVVDHHYHLCIVYKNIVNTSVISMIEVVKGDSWC